MTLQAEQLKNLILKLPFKEQIHLVQDVWDHISNSKDIEDDAEALEIALSRDREWDEGKVTGSDYESVRKRILGKMV